MLMAVPLNTPDKWVQPSGIEEIELTVCQCMPSKTENSAVLWFSKSFAIARLKESFLLRTVKTPPPFPYCGFTHAETVKLPRLFVVGTFWNMYDVPSNLNAVPSMPEA